MEWESLIFNRMKHPKKEAGEFAHRYYFDDVPNLIICSDDELSKDEVVMITNRAMSAENKGTTWVEVYVEGAELQCGFHKGQVRGFERIRRITGYLVGTLERFNNGKAAEERDRVKHEMGA